MYIRDEWWGVEWGGIGVCAPLVVAFATNGLLQYSEGLSLRVCNRARRRDWLRFSLETMLHTIRANQQVPRLLSSLLSRRTGCLHAGSALMTTKSVRCPVLSVGYSPPNTQWQESCSWLNVLFWPWPKEHPPLHVPTSSFSRPRRETTFNVYMGLCPLPPPALASPRVSVATPHGPEAPPLRNCFARIYLPALKENEL